MEKNVVIVNYNTTELTKAAILSLWKNTPDAKVTVFDNSDREPFNMEGVNIIDNTKGQLIDFDVFLEQFPNKPQTLNNWGSAKHMLSIQKLFELMPNGFVLMDSDILVKKDISELFDLSVAYSGEVKKYRKVGIYNMPRLLPFLCWINVPMCRQHNIIYFDPDKGFHLKHMDVLYDTGATFYEECNKVGLPFKSIKINEYMVHLGRGSWFNDATYNEWLEKHESLYKNEVKKKDGYLVILPYFKGGAQGREIEYAVAGWRKHFMERYQIVVVGDYHPVCDTGDDITFIECERVPEQPAKNYRPHIDFVKKFKAVRKQFPESKGFIYTTDDVYAVNDFDIHDVTVIKQNSKEINNTDTSTAWGRERKKTKELLQKEGYPVRNFVTHLPMWIEWDKLEQLWERFDMENNSYIFEDLYFNIFFAKRVPLQLNIDYDNQKCGVYRPNPRLSYIQDAFRKKIWIQNSVEGWIPELERMLQNYYGI